MGPTPPPGTRVPSALSKALFRNQKDRGSLNQLRGSLLLLLTKNCAFVIITGLFHIRNRYTREKKLANKICIFDVLYHLNAFYSLSIGKENLVTTSRIRWARFAKIKDSTPLGFLLVAFWFSVWAVLSPVSAGNTLCEDEDRNMCAQERAVQLNWGRV